MEEGRIGGLAIKLSDGTFIRIADVRGGWEGRTLYRWDGTEWKKLTKAELEELLKPKTKICKGCGKEFIPINGNQCFCSAECRKPRKKPPQQKICVICGKPFIPNYAYQKYCCKECADEKNREYARKNYHKYKVDPNCEKRTPKKYSTKYDKAHTSKSTKDPYEWLRKVNEHLRANDGKYVSK